MLAMFFPICEPSNGHRVDNVPLVNCLDSDGEFTSGSLFVYFEVRDKTRAPPQISTIPYFLYLRMNGLSTNDNTNVNISVISQANVEEVSVNGDRGTTPAHLRSVVEDAKHSRRR
jgi:hypothetical protein